MDTSGVRTTKSTYFDKATRTCKICTIRTTKECKKGGKWHWNRNDRDCKVKDGEEECKEVKKECKDFTDELCLYHTPNNENKYCLFIDNKCQEEYSYCEAYSSSISENNRKKEECESIIPKYLDGYQYKCIFTDSKTCEKKKIENCEDYEGTDEDYCESLTITDSSTYNCIMKNNKCTRQFKDCDAYDRQSTKEQATCESIILEKDYKKCVFNSKTKECYEDYKTCSEYTGNIAENCGAFRPSGYDSKVCISKIINASKRQIMFLNIVPITKEKINPYVNQFSHLKVI
jgi:hypothetical protein